MYLNPLTFGTVSYVYEFFSSRRIRTIAESETKYLLMLGMIRNVYVGERDMYVVFKIIRV